MCTNESTHTLPEGYVLNRKYIIDYVRGEGGFGITYAAHSLDSHRVAIKEYFPSGVASRDHTKKPYTVTHFGGEFSRAFKKGLQRFLNEAVLLKEFSYLQSIVTILDVFEENDTAYLVMEFIEGITIKQLVSAEGKLSFSDMYNLMLPIMKDLAVIHEKGLIHRDISPDNLLVGMDNRLHLIDFGSVSYANPNESKTMTVILKAGYAPPEQYLANGHVGAWTDVYGLCATMYYILTGNAPTDALTRMQQTDTDFFPFPKGTDVKMYQWKVLTKGLELSYSSRYPSVKILYQALSTPEMTDEPITEMMISQKRKPKKKYYMYAAIILITLTISTVGILHYIENTTTTPLPQSTANPDTQESFSNKTVKMCKLTGLTLENAAAIVAELDSELELKTTYKYDDTYAIGTVTAQSIPADSTYDKSAVKTLTLTISKGPEPTTENRTQNDTEVTTQSTTAPQQNKQKKESTTESKYTTIHLD